MGRWAPDQRLLVDYSYRKTQHGSMIGRGRQNKEASSHLLASAGRIMCSADIPTANSQRPRNLEDVPLWARPASQKSRGRHCACCPLNIHAAVTQGPSPPSRSPSEPSASGHEQVAHMQ